MRPLSKVQPNPGWTFYQLDLRFDGLIIKSTEVGILLYIGLIWSFQVSMPMLIKEGKMKKAFIITIGLLLVAVFSVQAAWILPDGRGVNRPRQYGPIPADAFGNAEKMKQFGIKDLVEKRHDGRYYWNRNAVRTDTATVATFTYQAVAKYSVAELGEIKAKKLEEQFKALLSATNTDVLLYLGKGQALPQELVDERAAIEARYAELITELDVQVALDDYGALTKWRPDWDPPEAGGEESGVTP